MSTYIVGRNPVIECLQSGSQVERLCIAEGNRHARIRQIVAMAERVGIPIKYCTRRELDRLEPSLPHQGVVAVVRPAPYYSDLSSMLSNIQHSGDNALLVMLDGVQDPMNFGAILRTAEAANTDAVIIPKDRAVGITAAVHKASAGASAHIPIVRVTNLARTVDTLKEAGIWVAGAAEDASCRYTDADFSVPLCLVLGGEGTGIRRLVKQQCDYLVHLPMLGKIASLNVSVAAGILLYEVVRQRHPEP